MGVARPGPRLGEPCTCMSVTGGRLHHKRLPQDVTIVIIKMYYYILKGGKKCFGWHRCIGPGQVYMYVTVLLYMVNIATV